MPSEDRTSEQTIVLAEQLRNALNAIPVNTWYAVPSGALTFTNEWGQITWVCQRITRFG
jgi:hypothetical protein